MDLPHLAEINKQVDPEILIRELFKLFRRVNNDNDSRVLRFLGFKTDIGIDEYPAGDFSVSNLFEPSIDPYSSDSI